MGESERGAEATEPERDDATQESFDPVDDRHDVEMKDAADVEEDAPADSRDRLGATVDFNLADATLNVLPAKNKVLMSLGEGGFQYLLAGIRANVGIRAGRYAFELSMVEILNPAETEAGQRAPMPRNLVRMGFSLARTSLFLADSPDSFCFDSEGYFVSEGRRVKVGPKLVRDQVVTLVLNLDENSKGANTISLFRDGERVSVQTIPEILRGKPLVPTLVFKNVSIRWNFASEPISPSPLPFKCRMLQDAAAEDVELLPSHSQDGKCHAVFPVGLPDTGIFDWADDFLEKHPDYTEVSDRKIQEWAVKSGMWRAKGQTQKGSNDKPEMNFGIPLMDDMSVANVLTRITPALQRNILVMELRSNLLASERKAALIRFGEFGFNRVARVMIGEPSAEYKDTVRNLLHKDKVAKAEVEKKRRAQEDERRRLMEERRRKAEEAKRAKDGPYERKEDWAEEAKARGEARSEGADGSDAPDAPIELTEEEKNLWARTTEVADLSQAALSRSFTSFSLPSSDEGFNEVRYEWRPADESAELLKNWKSSRKLTIRVEDLQPSQWFKDRWQSWQKCNSEWRRLQGEWKDPAKRRTLLQRRAERKQKEKEEREAKEAKDAKDAKRDNVEGTSAEQADVTMADGATPEVAAANGAATGAPEADLVKTEADTPKVETPVAETPKAEPKVEVKVDTSKAENETPMDVDADSIDVDTVEDVTDIGSGEPLFANFVYEDWVLLTTRVELHLLLHAFQRDLGDPERSLFHEMHMGFYYSKYFNNKTFSLKSFGVEKLAEFLEMIPESIEVGADGLLRAKLAEDTAFDGFLRHTEESRRERQRSIDAGDETARLKFLKPAPPPPRQQKPPPPPPQQTGRGGNPSDGSWQKRPYQSSSGGSSKRTNYGSYGSGSSGYGGSYSRR